MPDGADKTRANKIAELEKWVLKISAEISNPAPFPRRFIQ
jgi:hypothetical protein